MSQKYPQQNQRFYSLILKEVEKDISVNLALTFILFIDI